MIAEKPKLKHTVAPLLLCAVFAAPGAAQMFAQDGRPLLVAAIPASEERGLTQKANELGHLFGLPITNSMVVTWITALGLIVLARTAMRHIKLMPERRQN